MYIYMLNTWLLLCHYFKLKNSFLWFVSSTFDPQIIIPHLYKSYVCCDVVFMFLKLIMYSS